ncbi:MAG: phosphatase PAP2 family protein [Bacteroidales bacterium]|jgi:undecaprenyl-diphosphatase|nr:phosphatase PAP2 family protein [Bacteroidales bacterium]
MLDTLIQYDQGLLLSLNRHHTPLWDVVMLTLTGTSFWLLFYAVLMYFICKRFKLKAIVALLLVGAGIALSDQASDLCKHIVERYRPTHDVGIRHLVHNVGSRGGLWSFFSAHAANTFTVAMFTSLLFGNRRYYFMLFVWAALVSYTRIYLGLHYPLDILTGAIVGILSGWLMYRVFCFFERDPFRQKRLKNKDAGYIGLTLVCMLFAALMTAKITLKL